MNSCRHFLSAFACALFAAGVSADVLTIDEPVTVDGRLDEPFWSRADVQGDDFVRLGCDRAKGAPRAQTRFRMAADARALYVGIEADEPALAKLQATKDKPGLLWFSDDVQVFLSPEGSLQNYYQYVCCYRNGLDFQQFFAEAGHITPDAFGSEWRYAKADGDGRFTVEIAIPLSSFYMTRNANWKDTWLVNVTRCNRVDGDGYTTWSPLEGNFHESKRFRSLGGFPRRAESDDVAVQSVEAKMTGAEGGRFTGVLKLGVFAKVGGGAAVSADGLAETKVTLKSGLNEVTVACAYPGNGRHLTKLAVRRTDGAGAGRVYRRTYPVAVDFDVLKATFSTPAYRDNFYPGQDSSRIAGCVASVLSGPVTLTLEGPGIPRAERTLAAGGGAFAFETPGFTAGTATLTMRAGGETRTASVRKLAPSGRSMTWVEKGRLVRDGRPFLRHSMYNECYGYLTGKAYDELWAREKGNFHIAFVREVCLEAGRLCGDGIESEECVKDVRPSRRYLDRVDEVIAKNRDTDFCYYYLADEPECRGLSEIYLRHCYEYVKAKDPYHPVLISSRAGARYLGCCDWIEAHPYLDAFTDADGTRAYGTPPSACGDFISPLADLGRADKVVGCIPATFSYVFNNPRADYPTFRELVVSVWACAAHGARTFWPYLHADLRDRPALWRGLPYVFSSLETMSDYLLDGTRRTLVRTPTHEVVEFSLNGRILLVAMNYSAQPVPLRLPGYEGVYHEFRGSRTFPFSPFVTQLDLSTPLAPFETVLLTSDNRQDSFASTAETAALVDREESARLTRDNQLLMRHADIDVARLDGQPAGGPSYCLFDGVYERMGWRDTSAAPKGIELGFRGFAPSFDRLVLHGDGLGRVKVRACVQGAWRDVTPVRRAPSEYRLELDLGAAVRAERLRLEFPKDAPAELYEIELPKCRAAGTPRLTFGVLSDIHMIEGGSGEDAERFRRALRYFDARRADAVVVSGDLTQNGNIGELRRVGAIWDEVFPNDRRSDGGHVEKLFICGDHEVERFTSGSPGVIRSFNRDPEAREAARRADIALNDRAKQWRAAFREDFAPIVRKTVKGYDFVLAHLYNDSAVPGLRYAEPLYIPGLEEFFRTNSFDRARPLFYVQHKIPKGTVGGPSMYGQDAGRTSAVLKDYPNAVAFCGHKHRSSRDERMLWQGAFTAIEVPGCNPVQTEAGYENGATSADRPNSAIPRQLPRIDLSRTAQGLFATVYDDRIVFERREFFRGGEIAEPWVVPVPNDGSAAYERRAARAQARPLPRFRAGAAVTARKVDGRDRNGRATAQIEVVTQTAPSLGDVPRAYAYEFRAVVTKGFVTRTALAKRVFAPEALLAENFDRGQVRCAFALGEIPSDHDTVVFEVRPIDAFGRFGEPISSAPQSFNPEAPCLYPF